MLIVCDERQLLRVSTYVGGGGVWQDQALLGSFAHHLIDGNQVVDGLNERLIEKLMD
jgi:hypothetical protein